jgi:haloalkane dehalogenase
MPFEEPPGLPPFIARQVPFRRRLFELDSGLDQGRRIHLIDEGKSSSRPVLMLHGNPTWSFLWRKVIARLPEFRCVAPDMLGLGLSDRLPNIEDHSLERHTEAIAALVSALDLRNAVLVGQDWGGPIGVCVAARDPRRFTAVVL